MKDTRFTAEFWINKQGELVGSCRLPKENTVVLEALVEIVQNFAAKNEMEFNEVLSDLSHLRSMS